LIETGYLASLLLLSLVLPLLMSFRGPRDPATRSACTKMVWIGQALGVVAALAALASASVAPYATLFGVLSYSGYTLMLLQRFRGDVTA